MGLDMHYNIIKGSNIVKFYCHHCQKEFELPEWCTKCPECLGDDLEINDKAVRQAAATTKGKR